MALEENKYDHLVELGGSNYEIVDGEPDIRGWDVKNERGQQIGEVEDLLFNPHSRKVRYIVVDLDGNTLGLEQERKILVPIGVAILYDGGRIQDNDSRMAEENEISEQIDSRPETTATFDTPGYVGEGAYDPYTDGKVVIVPVNAEQLIQLPAYRKDYVDPETELTVRRIFEIPGAAGISSGSVVYSPDEFYTHEHFDEDKFYSGGKLSSIENNRNARIVERHVDLDDFEEGTTEGDLRDTEKKFGRPDSEQENF